MRKIHKSIALNVSRGFSSDVFSLKLNQNVRISRDVDFGNVRADFYGKEVFCGDFKNRSYQINLRMPFSSTFKGYLNAVLTGLGSFRNSNFYVKNGKICNDAVKKDSNGYFIKLLDGSKLRLFFDDEKEKFSDCNFKNAGGVK